MSLKGIATKRKDVYKHNPKRKKRLSSTQTNLRGEFISRGDIARGLDHFNQNRLAGEEIK